jgi:hypothetical protein
MEQRYVVCWSDWKAMKAEAVKAGWQEPASILDFVIQEYFDRDSAFPTFAAALAHALKVQRLDTWNCPRIYRQSKSITRDDYGDEIASWDSEALVEVNVNDPTPPTEADMSELYDFAA